jgi:hypothetical protein
MPRFVGGRFAFGARQRCITLTKQPHSCAAQHRGPLTPGASTSATPTLPHAGPPGAVCCRRRARVPRRVPFARAPPWPPPRFGVGVIQRPRRRAARAALAGAGRALGSARMALLPGARGHAGRPRTGGRGDRCPAALTCRITAGVWPAAVRGAIPPRPSKRLSGGRSVVKPASSPCVAFPCLMLHRRRAARVGICQASHAAGYTAASREHKAQRRFAAREPRASEAPRRHRLPPVGTRTCICTTADFGQLFPTSSLFLPLSFPHTPPPYPSE